MKETITYEAEASTKKQVKKYQIFSYVVTLKCVLICGSTTTRCQGAPWRGSKSFTHPWTRLELFSLSPSRMNQWCHQNWFSLSDHFLSPWLLSWPNVPNILFPQPQVPRSMLGPWLFFFFFFFFFVLLFLFLLFPLFSSFFFSFFFSFFPFSFLFSLLFSLHL